MSSPSPAPSTPPTPQVHVHDEEALMRARKCTFLNSLLMVAGYITVFATFSAFPSTTTATPPPTDYSSSPTTPTRKRKRARVTPNRRRSTSTTATSSPTDASSSSTTATNRNRVRVTLNRRGSTHLTLTVKSKPQPQPQPQPQFANHTTPLLAVFLACIMLWSTFLKALVMLLAYHLFVKMFFPNIGHPTLVGLWEGLPQMSRYQKVAVAVIFIGVFLIWIAVKNLLG